MSHSPIPSYIIVIELAIKTALDFCGWDTKSAHLFLPLTIDSVNTQFPYNQLPELSENLDRLPCFFSFLGVLSYDDSVLHIGAYINCIEMVEILVIAKKDESLFALADNWLEECLVLVHGLEYKNTIQQRAYSMDYTERNRVVDLVKNFDFVKHYQKLGYSS